jgi:hypothetical protein
MDAVMKPLVMLCISACALVLSAATYTWTGAVDDKWSNPGNWKVGAVVATTYPQTNDDVVWNVWEPVTRLLIKPVKQTCKETCFLAGSCP